MTKQQPIVVESGASAELLDGLNPMRLLADSDASNGAVSITSGTIAAGADNAKPHFHEKSWEFFYILSGTMEILLDDSVESIAAGGLVGIPPRVVHAFGATEAEPVEGLGFITPGVQRFDYFRLLPKILRGEIPPDELAAMHKTYDVHFSASPLWERHRRRR